MTTHSKGNSVVSRRWKLDVKKTVNSYDFVYTDSYDVNDPLATGRTKRCEFCGNHLVYVAVVEGKKIAGDDTLADNVKYHIGFDCLTLTLGKDWVHYSAVKKEIALLKEKAARARRKNKYAVDYKDLITELKNVPDSIMNNNPFYRDMLNILTTGRKSFSKNMETSLRVSLDRLQENLKKNSDSETRLEYLLQLIIKVDRLTDLNNVPRWSAYGFVANVKSFFMSRGFLSSKQKEALNKIHKRYTEKDRKQKNSVTAPSMTTDAILDKIPY